MDERRLTALHRRRGDSTGLKLPASLTFLKKSMPGPMSSRLPPLASAAAHTPLNAAAACVGLPLSATWPLYCGSSSSAIVVGHFATTEALQPIEMKPP